MKISAEVTPSDKLKKISDTLKDGRTVMKKVGVFLVGRFSQSFNEQRRGPFVWPPRKTPNIAGIIQDVNKGSQPKKRRFDARPALVDTGHLKRSINWRSIGNWEIEIGTTVPYAGIHQTGGTSTLELTQTGRKTLSRFLKRNKDLRPKLGWLFSKTDIEVRVPKRPFLFVSIQEQQILKKNLGVFITQKS